MPGEHLLIYGANGYVGEAAARLAVQQGLNPVLAGRNATEIESLAHELGARSRVFPLDDAAALDASLADVTVVLHLAGPYLHTAKPMVEACLRNGAHYLDITGELPVLEALAARDAEAKERGVMIMPAVGLDSVPSDCLAAHLVRRLPSATQVRLALQVVGPAGLPPGTQRTMIELAHLPDRVVRGGELVDAEAGAGRRIVDFGSGPVTAVRFQAPDPFVVHHTTGIADIEMYVALPAWQRVGYRLVRRLRPVFRPAPVRKLLQRFVLPAPSAAARAKTVTHVWAEASDGRNEPVASRLHGPEGALVWTTRAALSVVRKVLAGAAPPGFQTPAGAYGPELVLESEGVIREDVR